jgi:multisubunit Na+/H+ antiporter MnhB subunit
MIPEYLGLIVLGAVVVVLIAIIAMLARQRRRRRESGPLGRNSVF